MQSREKSSPILDINEEDEETPRSTRSPTKHEDSLHATNAFKDESLVNKSVYKINYMSKPKLKSLNRQSTDLFSNDSIVNLYEMRKRNPNLMVDASDFKNNVGKPTFNQKYKNDGPKKISDQMLFQGLKMPKVYCNALTHEMKK